MQYVDLNKFNLSLQEIEYGVPQGSALDSLLFLNFIVDIANATVTIPRLCADDPCLIVNELSQNE